MHNQWWLLLLLFAALAISTYFTIRIIWPRNYLGAVVDLNKHQEYFSLSTQELTLQLIADTQKSILENTASNSQKSDQCITAIVLSLASIGFLVGCII